MTVIHTDLDGLVRIGQLEYERDMALEKLLWFRDKHRKALRHAQYCGDQWDAVEDRADRLAVVADALAEYIEWMENEFDFAISRALDRTNAGRRYLARQALETVRADCAEAKLREFRKYIEEHSEDLPAEYSQLVNEHFWELI
jgi:hypothetical protein